MADIIDALYRKRASLLAEKKKVQLSAEIRMQSIDNEIGKIDKALKTLDEAVQEYLCPHCKGLGTTRRADAAGQMEDWPCEKCSGTGVFLGGDKDG